MKKVSIPAQPSYVEKSVNQDKIKAYFANVVNERLNTLETQGLIGKDKDGNIVEVITDSVIMSVGYTPAPLAEKGRHIHVIGDADKVGNLRTVIWGAWDVAMKL